MQDVHDLDRAILDPFYLIYGFSQGELTEIISYFTNQLDQERKEEGTLNEKERELLKRLLKKRKILSNCNKGAEYVTKLIMRLMMRS